MKRFLNSDKKRLTFLLIILAVLVVTIYIFTPFSVSRDGNSNSAAIGVGGPFGGRITGLDFTCAGGWVFTLGPPSPGTYFYPNSALTYLFGPPYRVGQWTLGLVSPGGICDLGPKFYVTNYTVIMIGTSNWRGL